MALFPNVPNVPGVPPLARNPLVVPPVVTLLVADAVTTIFNALFGPQWGIFKDNIPVVISDNVVSLDFKNDWSVSNFPVEQGGFESYDKVASPFEVRVRFSSGGPEPIRQLLLDSVESVARSLDLFDVATPERIYRSVNINHYDYRRTAVNGVGLLIIDVWGVEVRVTAQTAFSNTASPSGANPVNSGTVQPQTPTPTQTSALPAIQ